MKSGFMALAAVVFLAGFLLLGSMLMLGAVGGLDTDDVPTGYNETANLSQTFFSVFQDWNVIIIWLVGITALIIGLWFLLRTKK